MRINHRNLRACSFPLAEKVHASWSIATGTAGEIYISADCEDRTGTARLLRYDPPPRIA